MYTQGRLLYRHNTPGPENTDGAPKGAISGADQAADLGTALPGAGGGFPLQANQHTGLTRASARSGPELAVDVTGDPDALHVTDEIVT